MNRNSKSKQNIENMYKKKDIAGLIESLNNRDINVRAKAFLYLKNLGAQALEPLIQALKVDDRSVRRMVVCILGYIGDVRAVESLAYALKDTDWRVRKNAATSLGKIGDKRAVEVLIQAIKDKYLIVQEEEIKDLEVVLERNKDLKKDTFDKTSIVNYFEEVTPIIQSVMHKYWFNEIPVDLDFIKYLKEKKEVTSFKEKKTIITLGLKNAVIRAIGTIGRDIRTVELIIKDLKDNEYKDIRNNAIGHLLYYMGEEVEKSLIQLLKDDDSDVRKAAKESIIWNSSEFGEGITERLIKELGYRHYLDEISENTKTEFKSSLRWDINKNCVNRELQKDVAKTIAAFLNTYGGTLLIGVLDDCKIYGIDNDIKTLNKRKNKDGFKQALIQVIVKYIGTELIKYINIRFEKREEKVVCRVEINKSLRPVYLEDKKDKEFYIRAGNTTRKLNIEEAIYYINDHWKKIK